MIPYAVLRRSGLADVSIVAPEAGPIPLVPALKIRPQGTWPVSTGCIPMVRTRPWPKVWPPFSAFRTTMRGTEARTSP